MENHEQTTPPGVSRISRKRPRSSASSKCILRCENTGSISVVARSSIWVREIAARRRSKLFGCYHFLREQPRNCSFRRFPSFVPSKFPPCCYTFGLENCLPLVRDELGEGVALYHAYTGEVSGIDPIDCNLFPWCSLLTRCLTEFSK